MTNHEETEVPVARPPSRHPGRVGARRLPPVREGDDLGAWGGAGRACGISRASACSTSPRDRQHGDPRRRGRGRGCGFGSDARELRGGPPQRPRPRGSSWSGSRPTPRHSRSQTASSTSSPPRSVRSSPPTTRRWPTRCCACAGLGARSGCSTSRPRADHRLLRRVRALHAPPPPGALPPALWGARSTCGSCSATGSSRWRWPAGSTWRGRRAHASTASSSSRRSGRSSPSTRASPRSPSARRRSTTTSSSSPPARTADRLKARGVPLRVPARGRRRRAA